ncbi:MAG: hypothetical protein SOT91_02845 [Bacilli bacterium]|nr:hypothetical protein [Clostridium sp.]MDY2804286.1 hypothetical protein [Bacilli bacterium]
MNNTYFIIDDIKYIIAYDNNQLKIKKMENNLLYELTETEKGEINRLISHKTGYIYYSEKVINIVNNNPNLFLNNDQHAKEQLINLLNWLEDHIPIEHRQTFYDNLSTLTLMHNFNLISSDYFVSHDSHFSQSNNLDISIGGYNSKTNNIEISPQGLWHLWKVAQTTDNPNEYYFRQYMQTLLHELIHMSSTKFNKEGGIALSGFDKYPSQDIKEQNVGLNEGYTELIAMAGVPGTEDIVSPYFIECALINQLIQIIGIDALQESYFGNKGTELLESELCKLINDKEKAFELFRSIEVNYQLGNGSEKQNILGNIQLTMLDYLEKKLEILSVQGKDGEINKIIYFFENMIVTPRTLQAMGRDANIYEGVTDSIIKLDEIKGKYGKQLDNNSISR